MTATVAPPPGATHLKRRDPAARTADYVEALRFYLSLPDEQFDRVVFADNSAGDVGPLREVAAEAEARGCGKAIRIKSFQANDHPPEYGKAFGEFRLMNKAIDDLLQEGLLRRDDRPFWKVTGRLRCTNLAKLDRTLPDGVPFLGDFRRYRKPWLDLRAWAATIGGYDAIFRGRLEVLREDRLSGAAPEEELFASRDRQDPEWLGTRPRFRIEPEWLGRGGQFDNDLSDPRLRRKAAIRRVTRSFAPWIWI